MIVLYTSEVYIAESYTYAINFIIKNIFQFMKPLIKNQKKEMVLANKYSFGVIPNIKIYFFD